MAVKTYKVWQDYERDSIDMSDLQDFAIQLWKEGCIKVENRWDNELNKSITTYTINVIQEE
jgi:hypothetical protein